MKKHYKYLTDFVTFVGVLLILIGLLSGSYSDSKRLICIFLGGFAVSISITTANKLGKAWTTKPTVVADPTDLVISTNEEWQAFLETHTLVDTIRTKVVGVTFNNKDGTSRQDILASCSGGDEVGLKRFTYRDSPAYAVMSQCGQIGNLSADLARVIDSNYDDVTVRCTISAVTGGCGDHPYGCNLIIEVYQENAYNQSQHIRQPKNEVIPDRKYKQSTVDSSFIAQAQWYAARGGEDLVDDE